MARAVEATGCDDVDQLVDGDQLAAAQVERLGVVALYDPLGAVDAVVDVREAAGLFAVAPDIDRMPS